MNKKLNKKSAYYDFNYFFASFDKDKHRAGIKIEWEYTNNSSDLIEKGAQRWMRYIKNDGTPRRPKRGAQFVGLSRIVPAFERRGYNKLFSNVKKPQPSQENLKKYVESVMGRQYEDIQFYEVNNYTGSHRLNSYETHTGFNAGAGEECIINILNTLLSSDDGSFIVIEEIEIGLHPGMMSGIVDAILEIALEKKHQILITSHSPEFLRACPREALVLAERAEGKIHFTHDPRIESVVANIGGKHSKELFIICEDDIAAMFISKAMSVGQRRISEIKGYGGKNDLYNIARTLNDWTSKKIMIIWDGDVDDNLVFKIDKDRNIVGIKFSFTQCPEGFIKSLIIDDSLKNGFQNKYRISDLEWNDIKNKISVLEDNHDIFYVISCVLGLDPIGVKTQVCDMVGDVRSDIFNHISNEIDKVLTS